MQFFANRFLLRVVFAGLIAMSQPALANDVTVDSVYGVVDLINRELELFHEANDSVVPEDEGAADISDRQPRHVMQKAREVILKLSMLRRINSLSRENVPEIPAKKIEPADMMVLAEKILSSLQELKAIFNVNVEPKEVPVPSGKTATDVYVKLDLALRQINALGVPATVANDVYRFAQSINNDLQLIGLERGMLDEPEIMPLNEQIKTGDVYDHVFDLLLAIMELQSVKKDFEIPGGTALSFRREGHITAGHVLDALNNALAEIGAIKVVLGVTSPTELDPQPAGKTPADAYNQISKAIAFVRKLMEHEAAAAANAG